MKMVARRKRKIRKRRRKRKSPSQNQSKRSLIKMMKLNLRENKTRPSLMNWSIPLKLTMRWPNTQDLSPPRKKVMAKIPPMIHLILTKKTIRQTWIKMVLSQKMRLVTKKKRLMEKMTSQPWNLTTRGLRRESSRRRKSPRRNAGLRKLRKSWRTAAKRSPKRRRSFSVRKAY